MLPTLAQTDLRVTRVGSVLPTLAQTDLRVTRVGSALPTLARVQPSRDKGRKWASYLCQVGVGHSTLHRASGGRKLSDADSAFVNDRQRSLAFADGR